MKKKRRAFLKQAGAFTLGAGLLPFTSFKAYSNGNATNSCSPCTQDYYGEGPFYTQNPPDIQNGQLAATNEPGERLVISGRVTNLDCSEFIAGAIVDVWHADDSGAYDNTGFNLRGKVKTDENGYYSFETIKPGKYLNGTEYRPSHIHFKITAPGKPVLTTQLYFQGDSSIPNDAAASINSGTYDASDRIIPIKKEIGKWTGTWDIAVAGEGELIKTGISDNHLDKGLLYSIYPNPFTDNLNIKIGVFNTSKITIGLYDEQGRRVDQLVKGELPSNKYEFNWRVKEGIQPGNYIVSLLVNDLQVHYLKVLKL